MKKYLKWIVIVIVIIAIFGAIGSGSSKDENNEDDKTVEQKEEKEEKNEEEEKVYSIGQTLTVGDVEYTVNSISSSKNIGTEYLNNEAQEMYLIVNISIKNNGDDSLSVSDNFFKLKKGEKEFSTDTKGNMYLDQSIIYESINPEATLTGNICFDVTQETIDDASLQLQVQTGAWGTEKGLINLH